MKMVVKVRVYRARYLDGTMMVMSLSYCLLSGHQAKGVKHKLRHYHGTPLKVGGPGGIIKNLGKIEGFPLEAVPLGLCWGRGRHCGTVAIGGDNNHALIVG